MKNNKKTALSQDKFAALRLAELRMTDFEDFESCVADMERTASLNSNEAVEVAKAIRAKYLPGIAREAGFSEDVTSQFINLEDGNETADFAKETHNDDEEDMSDDDTDELTDDMDDMDDDDSEVEDDDIATFEIEVPAEMVDAAQKAVQEALDRVLGGNDSDDDMDMDDDEMSDDMDIDSDEDEMEDDSEEHQMHKSSRREKTMTRQALAARRAEREQILRRTEREQILQKFASTEGEVSSPASAGFQHSDKNQYHGEMKYPTMKFNGHHKLDGQEAIDEQDVTFPKGKVPTKNPEYLQLGDSIEASRFEGSEDGSLDYELDLPVLSDIPSNNEADLDHFEIPTDQDLVARNTTKVATASAEKKCECCNKSAAKMAASGKKVHSVKCAECKSAMKVCDDCVEKDADCPHCEKKKKAEDHGDNEVTAANEINVNETLQKGKELVDTQETANNVEQMTSNFGDKLSSVSNARIKAAYSCATKLALAGIINSDECDAYADQLLEDGLRADVMIKNTQLLLRSAQASAERVAAAAAQKLNTRTASAMSISTSPALSGSASAALDIQSALKGTWTMPKIED
jgi:hypothetical protein